MTVGRGGTNMAEIRTRDNANLTEGEKMQSDSLQGKSKLGFMPCFLSNQYHFERNTLSR